jgi:hypothetical protein
VYRETCEINSTTPSSVRVANRHRVAVAFRVFANCTTIVARVAASVSVARRTILVIQFRRKLSRGLNGSSGVEVTVTADCGDTRRP